MKGIGGGIGGKEGGGGGQGTRTRSRSGATNLGVCVPPLALGLVRAPVQRLGGRGHVPVLVRCPGDRSLGGHRRRGRASWDG